jgi:hypothetical protein
MQAKVLKLSYKVVFELCREAIFKSNFRVKCVDSKEGMIICFSKEIVDVERCIVIRIKELEPSMVSVEVESRYVSREFSRTYEKVDEKIFIKHLSMIFK